jgi:hypothetical protein
MSVSFGPNLGFIINALTGDNFDAAFRAMLRGIDVLVMPVVKDHTLATPPGSPANGDRYIVAASPTGAWSGHAGSIAVWTTDDPAGNAWQFYAPQVGWIAFTRTAPQMPLGWNGSTWIPIAAGFLPAYTVAGLPTGSEGMIAFATDGRKTGEGAGSGTGVPCYWSGGSWRVYSTDAAVSA